MTKKEQTTKAQERNRMYASIINEPNYCVSDDGIVYRKTKTGDIEEVKIHQNKDGYYYVNTPHRPYCFIHQLVAEHFGLDVVPSDYVIDHINNCRVDNRIENLRAVPRPLNALNRDWFATKRNIKVSKEGKHHIVTFSMFGRPTVLVFDSYHDARIAWDALTAFKSNFYEQIIDESAIYPKTPEMLVADICLDDEDYL